MTDYATATIGMLVFGALITAAVMFLLVQPTDLPFLKKKK
jgi:hypothetical protein